MKVETPKLNSAPACQPRERSRTCEVPLTNVTYSKCPQYVAIRLDAATAASQIVRIVMS
jgi:hypothetical protein